MKLRETLLGLMVGVLTLVAISVGQDRVYGSESWEQGRYTERPAQCRGSIALTFDDGPDSNLTPRALDLLEDHEVQATFFVVGSQIEGNETIVQRMVEEGHSVQNHTWDHPYLTQLNDEQIKEQVQRTSLAIEQAGAPSPQYVRPPFGDYDTRVVEVVEQGGVQLVTWTNALDTRDWDGPATVEQIVERIQGNLQDGGVVLLHDVQQNTVDAIPEMINMIHEEGYCIDLYGDEGFWDVNA